MRKIILDKDQITNETVLGNILRENMIESDRKRKMLAYYKGRNTEIRKKVANDNSFTGVNNRIPNDFAGVISDTITSYFLGKPVNYNIEVPDYFAELDYELALQMSIFGYAVEAFYIDNEGAIQFKKLNPIECNVLVDDNDTVIAVLRSFTQRNWLTNTDETFADLYAADGIYHYKGDQFLTLIDVETNIFNQVPCIVYENNDYLEGDFEKVIPLIDAYDYMISNNIDSYKDSITNILCLMGVEFADEDEKVDFFNSLFENGIITCKAGYDVSGKEDAKFISGSTDKDIVEFTLKELKRNIFTFAQIVDFSSEDLNFGTSSGIAMQFRVLGLENTCSKKEAKFIQGLKQRLDVMKRFAAVKGEDIDKYELVFTRNLPKDELSAANTLQVYKNLGVSDETILAHVPIVKDVDDEKNAKANTENVNNFQGE